MGKLRKTEAELKKSVAYKKSVYFTRKLDLVSNISGMIVGLNAIYEGFIYFIPNILYLPYISAKPFLSAVWKLSADLRLQKSESLKRVNVWNCFT